jgi:hypothetical protein
MWAKRAEQFRDLHLSVDLEPGRVLDAADYLARHAARYGIDADIELRRAPSGWAYDRHLVVGHSRRSGKAQWVVQLALAPDLERETHVTLALGATRRFGRAAETGRAVEDYRRLFAEALRLAAAPRDPRLGNVIVLRPYAELPPARSA